MQFLTGVPRNTQSKSYVIIDRANCAREDQYIAVWDTLYHCIFKQSLKMDSITFFDWHVYVEGKFSTSQQNDKRVHVCMLYSLINMSDVYEELSM